MKLNTHPDFQKFFDAYPESVRNQMVDLRNLVLETAEEIENLNTLEETLKWGEPSYLAKHGSTLRMDWKSKKPDQFAMYFKCTSRLVETFKAVHGNTFDYEGNRAIVFQLNGDIPKEALKECIKATLTYHKVKHLPTLGM